MTDNIKVIKDGSWFWPALKCECGAVGCYDLTTDIGCRACLIARGKITVVTQQTMPIILTVTNVKLASPHANGG